MSAYYILILSHTANFTTEKIKGRMVTSKNITEFKSLDVSGVDPVTVPANKIG
jgi:hypothetical protein